MKATLVTPALFLGVAGVLAAGCSVSVDAGRFSTREEQHWTVSGTPDLTLITFDGSVEVRSWDKPEVRVDVEKLAMDKAHAEAIQVQVEQSGGTIRVEAKKPPAAESLFGLRGSPTVRLIATVPRRCNVVARTDDGAISIERIDGRIELNSGDGSLVGTELNGSLRAHTGDGSLRFEDVRGEVDIDTGDGGGTLSGRLAAVRLRTGDGSLTVRAEDGSAMSDDWEIRTGDGGVQVELPDSFAARIDASTGDGAVHVSGFGEPSNASRSGGEESSLRRDLGGGGKLLRLRSGSGGITVKKI